MKIKLDDTHYLNSDKYCYWITTLVMPEKGKEPYERISSGYFDAKRDAIANYVVKKFAGSEATTFKELMEDLKALNEEVRSWKEVIENEMHDTN